MKHYFRCVVKKNGLKNWMIALGILWSWCAPMAGQALAVSETQAAPVEYEVKAAFVHNFAKFIEWPSGAFEDENSPLRIGILGEGPINTSLLGMHGKKIQNRPLQISKARNGSNLRKYHIVFVNPSEKSRMGSILRGLKGSGVLTIGDIAGFAEQCGVINFYMESGKIRFEINVGAAQREKLRVSSRLLRLARIVRSQCN